MSGARWILVVALVAGCTRERAPAPTTPGPTAVPAPAPVEPAPPEQPTDAAPDYATLPLPDGDDLVPALKHGVESHGCALTAQQGQRIAATCDADTIFLEQVGAELRYACQVLEPEPCKTLLGAIIAAAGKT